MFRKSRNMMMLTTLAALMGGSTDGVSFGPNTGKKGCRNGKPFNAGFDDERLAKAELKRKEKANKRLNNRESFRS